jgi:hypothetical protein
LVVLLNGTKNIKRAKMEKIKKLTCQKFGKEVEVNEKLKCLAPDKPCKFRLECPIYIIWKNED